MANLYKIKFTRTVTQTVEGIIEGSDKSTIETAVKNDTENQLTWDSFDVDESFSTATVTQIDEFVGQ